MSSLEEGGLIVEMIHEMKERLGVTENSRIDKIVF